jgi:hypothetical protein
MSKAYVAHGERAILVVGYDKKPAKAMKRVANLITEMQQEDEWLMLLGLNTSYDEDGYYHVTATLSTTV